MMEINEEIKSFAAFAPATCANVADGFDCLGFAVGSIGDEVILTRNKRDGLVIEAIESEDELPLAVDKNIATAVIKKFCHDHRLPCHFRLRLHKGIPLSSGMGGSAASAVAALIALNAFLKEPVNKATLASYAIRGEGLVSGSQHADNVVPCLYGGLTLTRSIEPIDVLQLPLINLFTVLVHPKLRVDTKDARAILPMELPLKTYVQQSANLASFIVALYESNMELMNQCLQDVLIEPRRSKLVKGFPEVKRAALEAGALGASLSGSGPSIFAFAKTERQANAIKEAIIKAFAGENVASQGWVGKISNEGALIRSVA